MEFEKIPTLSTFNYCQLNLRAEVCSVSYHPSDAMSWIRVIEAAQNIDDLRESHSITGKLHPNFETLDARIATALKKILMNTKFKREVYLEEQTAHRENRFLRGGQIAHMIYEYFRTTGSNESFLEFSDLVIMTPRVRRCSRSSYKMVRRSLIDEGGSQG